MSIDEFEVVDRSIRRYLSVSVFGKEKTGKTRFSLTFPDPIAFLDLDIGLGDEHKDFIVDEGKTVYYKWYLRQLPFIEDMDRFWDEIDVADAKILLSDIMKDLTYIFKCLREGNRIIETLVIDGGTVFWELVSKVGLEKEKERRGMEKWHLTLYKCPNDFFDKLLKVIGHLPVNFVITHRARRIEIKDEEGNPVAEKLKPRMQRDVPYNVDVAMEVFKQKEGASSVFYGKIYESRILADKVEHKMFKNPTYDRLIELFKKVGGWKLEDKKEG